MECFTLGTRITLSGCSTSAIWTSIRSSRRSYCLASWEHRWQGGLRSEFLVAAAPGQSSRFTTLWQGEPVGKHICIVLRGRPRYDLIERDHTAGARLVPAPLLLPVGFQASLPILGWRANAPSVALSLSLSLSDLSNPTFVPASDQVSVWSTFCSFCMGWGSILA